MTCTIHKDSTLCQLHTSRATNYHPHLASFAQLYETFVPGSSLQETSLHVSPIHQLYTDSLGMHTLCSQHESPTHELLLHAVAMPWFAAVCLNVFVELDHFDVKYNEI